jgi:hypothetical protein
MARRYVEFTGELSWPELKLSLKWPEQEKYEQIRPPLVLGSSVAERTIEVGIPERTLYHYIKQFREEGMPSLFSTEKAKRRVLPPAIRHMVVNRQFWAILLRMARAPGGNRPARGLPREA